MSIQIPLILVAAILEDRLWRAAEWRRRAYKSAWFRYGGGTK